MKICFVSTCFGLWWIKACLISSTCCIFTFLCLACHIGDVTMVSDLTCSFLDVVWPLLVVSIACKLILPFVC